MVMATKPLLKALADAGLGPRRTLADAIRQGRVQVNGAVVEDFRSPLNVKADRVSLDGRLVDLKPEPPVYLLLNKPRGVVSTTSDEVGRSTVVDTLPAKYRQLRLYPVGRLDKESTGLLLLTNDGQLTHRLTHPSFGHEKEYLVSIDARLTQGQRRNLEEGVELDDGMTHPATVTEVHAGPFNYSITLHEGRKRQVRRMFEHVGRRVLALKRVRMGGIQLGDLREGEVRPLTAQEVRALLSPAAPRSKKPARSP
jgi:pseudouridine synthase